MRKGSVYALICLVFPGIFPAVFASTYGVQPDLEILCQRFSIDKMSSDFVIVIDTSGTMNRDKLFDQVKKSVAEFILVLSPGDYLSILAFDSNVRYLVIPQRISDSNKDRICSSILNLPPPTGQKTDIGTALEKAVSELNRPGANKSQFLLFITDGKHEPTENSKYKSLRSEEWKKLREKAERVLSGNIIQSTGLGLTNYTDINLIQEVFPDAVPLIVDKDGLWEFFDRFRNEIRLRKLALQVESELTKGKIIVEPEVGMPVELTGSGSRTVLLRISSKYENLTASVDLVSAKFDNAQLSTSIPSNHYSFELNPGETKKCAIIVQNTEESSRFSLRKIADLETRLLCDLSLSFQPESALMKLNIGPRQQVNQSTVFRFRIVSGIATWQMLIIVIGLCIVALILWFFVIRPAVFRLKPAELYGMLTFIDRPVGLIFPMPKNLSGMHSVTIGADKECEVSLSGGNVEARHALIYAEKPDKVFIKSLSGKVIVLNQITGEETDIYFSAFQIMPGSVIKIGEYKIQWS